MHGRHGIPFTLMVVGFVLFLPVIIPVVFVMSAVENRRKRKAVADFTCVLCGQVLGIESIRKADEEFRKHMDDMRRSHPFVKFRIVRTCHAICLHCGARYKWLEKERTFVSEAPRPSTMGG